MRVIRAIARGVERPGEPLGLMDLEKLKAPEEQLLKSLKGNFIEQYINILQRLLDAYDFHKGQKADYELFIQNVLERMVPPDEEGNRPVITKKKPNHGKTNTASI